MTEGTKLSDLIVELWQREQSKCAQHALNKYGTLKPRDSDANPDAPETGGTTIGSEARHVLRNTTVTLTEGNPDKDVKATGRVTITSYQGTRGSIWLVRDAQGKYVGSLTKDRMAQLWHRYKQVDQSTLTFAPKTFGEEVVMLMRRYKSGTKAGSAATGRVIMKNHWAVPDEYMTALRNITGLIGERFASPLNVKADTTVYWAAFARDKVFGAMHDAYSSRMLGSLEVNPEYESEELEKAMEFGIRSTYAEEPVLLTYIYPHWVSRPHNSLVTHPRVLKLQTIPQEHFNFDTHEKYTGQDEQESHHAHWAVDIFLIGNQAGYDKYFHGDIAEEELHKANMTHGGRKWPVEVPTAEDISDSVATEHELHNPPDKPTDTTYLADRPSGDNPKEVIVGDLPVEAGITQMESSEAIGGDTDVYTDGSLRKGGKSGSGVYMPSKELHMAIEYSGRRSVLRAELVAILWAVVH